MRVDRIRKQAAAASRRSFLRTSLLLLPLFGRDLHAQPRTRTHRVAFVSPNEGDAETFRERLGELGFVEPGSLALRLFRPGEYRDREEMVRDAIAWQPDVIKVCYPQNVMAAKRLTRTIPIVFSRTLRPAESGLVDSIARPGGNVTGVITERDWTVMFELARLIAPNAKRIAVLHDSRTAYKDDRLPSLRQLSAQAGVALVELDIARFDHRVKGALESPDAASAGVLFSMGVFGPGAYDAYEATQRAGAYVAFQRRTRIPYISQNESSAELGAVMSSGPDWREHTRSAAEQTARILRGANPGNLPLVNATHYRLAINRRAAAEIGITVPAELILRADRLID